jgi:hypothetical protein
MKLMRALPVDDRVDLVVCVIKNTLESLNVRVADIVADATVRQDALRGRITEFRTAISQYEHEIGFRRQEIARLEAELTETTGVREHLRLAESGAEIPLPLIKPAHAPSSAPTRVAMVAPVDAASTSSPSLPRVPPFRPKLGGPK